MAKTNKRTSQGHRLEPKIKVKPLLFQTPFYSDESLTSWLIRASFRQFCPPLSFTWYYWRNFRVWTYDIDKGFEHINPQIHQDIAVLAETNEDNIRKHTLADFAISTGANPNSKVALTWTSPLSKRNRYSRIGSYHCSVCMDDSKAHLSLLWRFSWVVLCTKHGVILDNTCPNCNVAYQPQLIPLEVGKINHCYSCREKLHTSTPKLVTSDKLYEYQLVAESVYRNKKGLVFGEVVDIADWFETLLFLINMVRKGVNNIEHLLGQILLTHRVLHDMEEIVIPRSRLSFDSLDIKERMFLLECSYRLMQIPLDVWLTVCEKHKATQNSFIWSKDSTIPSPFMPVYKNLPSSYRVRQKQASSSSTSNPTSPEVVINHWERIKRRIEMEQAYEKYRENN